MNIADVSYFHSILKKVHDISELYLGIFFNIYFFKKYFSPKSRLLQPEKIFKRNDIQLRPSGRKKCSRGDQCTFAHDESQLRGKPDLAGDFLRDDRSPGARLIWWI